MIYINNNLSLSEDEVRFTFSRSGGPGGQNVNKVSTKATLYFDVAGSRALSDHQKELVSRRLGNRISREGVLQVVSAQFRTQNANREDALRRFAQLLAAALLEKPKRKRTRIPVRARESRLRSKKRRGMLKTERSGRITEE